MWVISPLRTKNFAVTQPTAYLGDVDSPKESVATSEFPPPLNDYEISRPAAKVALFDGRMGAAPDPSGEGQNPVAKAQVNHGISANLRSRIRQREVEVDKQGVEKITIEKDIGWLVSPEELLKFRKTAWIPRGENIPPVHTLDMSFWEACNRGMKGWMGPKLCGEWDVLWGPNKLRFFVMDGTNEENFLTYYTCSDIKVSWGFLSEQKGVVCSADLRDAYWLYNKKKIMLRRSDKQGKLEILRDIPEQYYDAIMVCIRELEVSKRAERLRDKRLKQELEAWKKQLVKKKGE